MSGKTYRLSADLTAITCLVCGRTSHNPNDVGNKFCGHCHIWHNECQFLLDENCALAGVVSSGAHKPPPISQMMHDFINKIQKDLYAGANALFDKTLGKAYDDPPAPFHFLGTIIQDFETCAGEYRVRYADARMPNGEDQRRMRFEFRSPCGGFDGDFSNS